MHTTKELILKANNPACMMQMISYEHLLVEEINVSIGWERTNHIISGSPNQGLNEHHLPARVPN